MRTPPRSAPPSSPRGMLVTSPLAAQLKSASARPSTAPANLQHAIYAARQKIHMRFKEMYKAF